MCYPVRQADRKAPPLQKKLSGSSRQNPANTESVRGLTAQKSGKALLLWRRRRRRQQVGGLFSAKGRSPTSVPNLPRSQALSRELGHALQQDSKKVTHTTTQHGPKRQLPRIQATAPCEPHKYARKSNARVKFSHPNISRPCAGYTIPHLSTQHIKNGCHLHRCNITF